MYRHTRHRGRKHFCRYTFFVVLVQKKILKRDVKDCFKINGKQMIKMPKTVNMLDSKTMKIKSNHHL